MGTEMNPFYVAIFRSVPRKKFVLPLLQITENINILQINSCRYASQAVNEISANASISLLIDVNREVKTILKLTIALND